MFKKQFYYVFFCIFFVAASGFPLVQVMEAKKDLLKLSPEIVPAGEATISANPISVSDLLWESLPRLIDCAGSSFGLALSTANNLYMFDPPCNNVARTLALSNVKDLELLIPGTNDFLLIQVTAPPRKLSRVELNTGKVQWSRDFDFDAGLSVTPLDYDPINRYFSATRLPRDYIDFRFPTTMHFDADKNQIAFEGLSGGGGYRFLIVDAASGQTVVDERYDLQRWIGGTLEIFISLERNEFKVFDTAALKFTMTGKFLPSDVLVKKGDTPSVEIVNRGMVFVGKRYVFSPFYKLIKKGPAPPVETGNRALVLYSDIDAYLSDGGLFLMSSSRNKQSNVGKINSLWVKFDSSGKRIGPIEPSPLTPVGLRVRYQGEGIGPAVLFGIKNKFMGPNVEHIVMLKQDGSMIEVPLPDLKYRYLFWADQFFQDGLFFYTLTGNVLYRNALGEAKAVPIWKGPAGNILDGDEGYKPPSSLYWEILDSRRSLKELPENGLPPAFKKYMDASVAVHGFGSLEQKNKERFQALRVWGEDLQRDLGDILLIPALLKGDSAVLVGIRLPQNEVIFQLPMMHFNGLPKTFFEEGVAFLFGLKYLDRQRALLMVGDKLNAFKIYTITRPAMQ